MQQHAALELRAFHLLNSTQNSVLQSTIQNSTYSLPAHGYVCPMPLHFTHSPAGSCNICIQSQEDQVSLDASLYQGGDMQQE